MFCDLSSFCGQADISVDTSLFIHGIYCTPTVMFFLYVFPILLDACLIWVLIFLNKHHMYHAVCIIEPLSLYICVFVIYKINSFFSLTLVFLL